MMRLELVDKYGLTNYYYSVLGVICDEQNNLHIMKDGYSYFVPKSLYRSYGLFTEKEDERVAICLNACEGITSEALENGLIEHLLEPFYPARQAKKDVQYLGKSIFEEEICSSTH